MTSRERAVAAIRVTRSGQWVANIYEVFGSTRRLAAVAHGSLPYVQSISVAYCRRAPEERVQPQTEQEPPGSCSRLKLLAVAENDEATGSCPQRP